MVRRQIKDKFEFKFARDLIAYVLGTRMKGLFWTPTAVFRIRHFEERIDSPFTPQVRDVVNEMLDNRGDKYHELYDQCCSKKPISLETYISLCWLITNEFLKPDFDVETFFQQSVLLAMFAGLSYLYGLEYAPHLSCRMIYYAVQDLKERGTIDDNFWNEMQDWAENQKVWKFHSKK